MFIKKKIFLFNYVINIKNKILGRISTFISKILTGKNKKINFFFKKDNIIIINIKKIKINKKKKKKIFYKHSKYPGGLKIKTLEEIYNKLPEKLIENSIKKMLKKKYKNKKLKFFKNILFIKNSIKYKILNIF